MVDNPEVGRELTIADLPGRERTVLVLGKDGDNKMATMWLIEVGPEYVEFRAGIGNVHLLLRRCLDAKLRDELDRVIHVYEYLGDV